MREVDKGKWYNLTYLLEEIFALHTSNTEVLTACCDGVPWQDLSSDGKGIADCGRT